MNKPQSIVVVATLLTGMAATGFETVAKPAWENMRNNATAFTDAGVSLSDRPAYMDAQSKSQLGL